MGRGRVQLKRIENKISRQVTFSKRRSGLLKKAKEISILCDADVALIIFSSKGKLFEYSSDLSSMDNILERYERHSQAQSQGIPINLELRASWTLEQPKLLSRIEALQRNLRNYAGEDLDLMSLRELQHLEHQIDTALRRVRSRKNQLVNESISQQQKEVRALQEQNNVLIKQLEQQNHAQNSTSFTQQSQQPMMPLPSLPMGLDEQMIQETTQSEEVGAHVGAGNNISLPHWMISHVNR
ncbi:hypothetical protein K2173_019993 [Erythroxylum novogranatense]|uniref:Uncharacterized protein n=1 Tax=Erythroxylum novogranatense TaxID=1862640 RepID=A0AAV8UA76_9ROSI|nr:hypothetical protein K2173_019993 [Erythroxylum novogranatense]